MRAVLQALAADKNVRTFSRVVYSEVRSPVDDDTLHGHVEALVQTPHAIGFVDLRQAVSQTLELSAGAGLSDISGQTGTGEVEGVHEAERRGSGGTARGQVSGKVPPELGTLVDAVEEDLLVLILEGKVEGLGGEISDDIGEVTSPEGDEALLLGDADHAVDDALVLHLHGDLLTGMLNLENEEER